MSTSPETSNDFCRREARRNSLRRQWQPASGKRFDGAVEGQVDLEINVASGRGGGAPKVECGVQTVLTFCHPFIELAE